MMIFQSRYYTVHTSIPQDPKPYFQHILYQTEVTPALSVGTTPSLKKRS